MIEIGNKIIGKDSVFIIADIGSNHLQDISIAKESIIAAKNAGVDAVKFQSIQTSKIYHKPNPKTKDFVRRLEFPENWYNELSEFCNYHNILFFSSPTYLEAIDLLESVNVPLYKIASAQIGVFPQIVDKIASLGKPTIISTGLVNQTELEKIIKIFEARRNEKLMILHCNSIYPTPYEMVNLKMIKYYKNKYPNIPIGYSDHTIGEYISLCSISLGAVIIEKHFTLSKEFDSPDSTEFAFNPLEMKNFCVKVRNVEKSLTENGREDKISEEEMSFKLALKTVLIAKEDIKSGELINNTNVSFRRHNEGLDCNVLFERKTLHCKYFKAKGQVIYPQDIYE